MSKIYLAFIFLNTYLNIELLKFNKQYILLIKINNQIINIRHIFLVYKYMHNINYIHIFVLTNLKIKSQIIIFLILNLIINFCISVTD